MRGEQQQSPGGRTLVLVASAHEEPHANGCSTPPANRATSTALKLTDEHGQGQAVAVGRRAVACFTAIERKQQHAQELGRQCRPQPLVAGLNVPRIAKLRGSACSIVVREPVKGPQRVQVSEASGRGERRRLQGQQGGAACHGRQTTAGTRTFL